MIPDSCTYFCFIHNHSYCSDISKSQSWKWTEIVKAPRNYSKIDANVRLSFYQHCFLRQHGVRMYLFPFKLSVRKDIGRHIFIFFSSNILTINVLMETDLKKILSENKSAMVVAKCPHIFIDICFICQK
jgi:hypothetical protein